MTVPDPSIRQIRSLDSRVVDRNEAREEAAMTKLAALIARLRTTLKL